MRTPASIDGIAPATGIVSLVTLANGLLSRIPAWIPQLALRVALAVPFYRSGLTKWDGWFRLSDSALYLFAQEFQLHLFGSSIPYPAPSLVALLSGILEIS